jgi:RNA polymerase sigma-70 factor, ECF subfamily
VGAEADNRARFAKLVTPYLSHAYRLARSLTGSQTDAEDVVQEACLRAFRGINSVADTNARAWLLTIVHHAACTWLRKNRPAALITVVDVAAVEAKQANSSEQDAETPETALIAKADRARLEAAIASLSLPYRETFTLREVEGLNYREIAEITSVPIGTVMSRLSRARDQLNELIERNRS